MGNYFSHCEKAECDDNNDTRCKFLVNKALIACVSLQLIHTLKNRLTLTTTQPCWTVKISSSPHKGKLRRYMICKDLSSHKCEAPRTNSDSSLRHRISEFSGKN